MRPHGFLKRAQVKRLKPAQRFARGRCSPCHIGVEPEQRIWTYGTPYLSNHGNFSRKITNADFSFKRGCSILLHQPAAIARYVQWGLLAAAPAGAFSHGEVLSE